MSKLINWFEEQSRWSRLRTLGNSGLVRSSVLMPVFGYMLLLNDKVHEYLTIKYDGVLLEYLPATWRIWLVFYGSFFVAIATILFIWRCPKQIKVYEAEFQMADAVSEHLFNHGQFKPFVTMVRKLHEERAAWTKPHLPLSAAPPPEMQNISPVATLAVYVANYWSLLNLQERGLRILIYLLFALGLGLLLVPSLFTFIQVTVLALNHFR